jgi:hypothetical protein
MLAFGLYRLVRCTVPTNTTRVSPLHAIGSGTRAIERRRGRGKTLPERATPLAASAVARDIKTPHVLVDHRCKQAGERRDQSCRVRISSRRETPRALRGDPSLRVAPIRPGGSGVGVSDAIVVAVIGSSYSPTECGAEVPCRSLCGTTSNVYVLGPSRQAAGPRDRELSFHVPFRSEWFQTDQSAQNRHDFPPQTMRASRTTEPRH